MCFQRTATDKHNEKVNTNTHTHTHTHNKHTLVLTSNLLRQVTRRIVAKTPSEDAGPEVGVHGLCVCVCVCVCAENKLKYTKINKNIRK